MENKNSDVLQNIEFVIQTVYKIHSELTDYDVSFALESLLDFYAAKERNREPRDFKLSENSLLVYENVKEICEFRLGNSSFNEDNDFINNPISNNELLNCLKKISNSVKKWTKRNGRQGYLEFVKEYMPNL
jgi:hypothetical protein